MVENPTTRSYAVAHKQCLWLSLFSFAFTFLWCVWWGIQIYFTFTESNIIQWKAGMEFVQIVVLSFYAILPWTLLAVTIIFCIKLLKGLKKGQMFSHGCVPWLVAWGVVYGLTDFIQSNAMMWGVNGEFSVLSISPSCIVVPMFVFMFAALFRLAVKVSEDSNLAI